jgi:hypothetical protein
MEVPEWRIAEMDVWDNEAIDLLGPAFIVAFPGEFRDGPPLRVS